MMPDAYLCQCALRGVKVEMAKELATGLYTCLRCGATEEGVREAQRLLQLDWQKGGDGRLSAARIRELANE